MKSIESDTQYEVTLGPIKIKDGLFMGDQLAAKDIEFIISNKVTHIVNTVVQSIPNMWEKFGVHYLSVGWTEKQTNIFDKSNEAVTTIFHFIEEAMEKGESCLIHSINGKSRASIVIVAYLMRKYQWSLPKCLQYVDSRKDRLQIRVNYIRQLEDLQKRLKQIYNLNDNWASHLSKDELTINNTFKNSLTSQEQYYEVPQFLLSNTVKKTKASRRVAWGEFSQKQENSQTVKNGETNLKPILRQYPLQSQNQTFFKRKNSTSFRDSRRNMSDSLDKLLFEDTKRNIYEISYSDKANNDEPEEKNKKQKLEEYQEWKDDLNADFQHHYFKPFLPKTSRKTTINNGTRPKSLDNKDFQCQLDSDKHLINKKSKHYQLVMASYKSLKAPIHAQLHIQSQKNLRAPLNNDNNSKTSSDDILRKNHNFYDQKKKKSKSKGSTISNPSKLKQHSKSSINAHKSHSPSKVKKTTIKSKIRIHMTGERGND